MTNNNPTEENPEINSDASDIEAGDIDIAAEEFQEVDEQAENQPADETETSIIEKLKAALEESEKRAMIAAADLENFRKRSAKNSQEQIKYAPLPMMAGILEAVDNLNRAIESAAAEEANSGLLEGVKMVSSQIEGVLKEHNCQAIESVGQPFDPNLHQAVQMQPSDEFDANVVMMEMRTGYRLHERVIRPSQVFVSTGPAAATSGNEES